MGNMGTSKDEATVENVAEGLRVELIEELRERARKAEDRAERYEGELSDLRKRHDELLSRLLPPAPQPGLFARWFGGKGV